MSASAAARKGREADAGSDLRAFVPRGSLRWLSEEPDRRHREVECSLVFVDISGFTAMSERLARLGKVGAEEVTDLLNQTFTRLLSVAYEDDGSLIKFGGDALLLQFVGKHHARRAVHAAWGMRRRLRDLQPLHSSAGQVRLRMSVGVHTGTLDEFLVGTHHRELLLVGPAITTTVTMEGGAGPGEILVSQAVVEALEGSLETTPNGVGYLLRSEPDVPPVVASPDNKSRTEHVAEVLLSTAVSSRLATGVLEAEHRPSVISFVKFQGTDALLRDRGPHATAETLERLVDLIDDAIGKDDVCLLASDVDSDGGKFVLTAGVPTSTEFDGERMLRALRQIVESDPPLPLKIGVNYGPVFAGVVGPWFRLTYTIIGDAVNLAARVMGKAEPGTVLATPEVLNRSQALFLVEELPPFTVKGKKHPVRAIKVGAVTSERLRRPRARFRLAGRQQELAALLEELTSAARGPGRMAQVIGPAGLGKSRLIDEVHERRPDARLFMAACNQYESTTPYHAIGQLVRELLGLPEGAGHPQLIAAVNRSAPGLEPDVPLLGDVLGIEVPDNDRTRDLSPSFRAEQTAMAAGRLLEAVVPEPAILVIEDLHWIDPESSRVVLALTRSVLPNRRWLLLLTSRTRLVLDPTQDLGERVVELKPLGEKEAREFVYAAVEEGLVSLERGQQLLDKAGGNPFFLQELLRLGATEEDVPDDVDALIQTQLDQLPPQDRELIGFAALLGMEIEPSLFEATTGISETEQRAAFSRLKSFLEPNGTGGFRFRHALVLDGAYGRMSFRRRRELHLRAVEALEVRQDGHDRPDLLALHTYHARDWEHARYYALEAARQASARFANLTAVAHYRRAIESGRHIRGLADADVAATWERLGDVLMLASSYEDAVAAYRRAMRLSGPDRHVRLCGQIGQLRERQGRYSEALRWFTRAAKLGDSGDGAETARLLIESAIVRIRQAKPRVALELAGQAELLDGDVQVQARVSYVKAWAAMLLGEDAADERRRTLELFEASGDLIGQGLAYNIISMAAYYRGDWDEAAVAYDRARILRRRVGDEVASAVASGNLGELLADQGHFDRAQPLLEDARSVCAAAGYAVGLHFVTMTLGRLSARLGRYEEADEQLRFALGELEGLKAGSMVREAHVRMAELALFRGELDVALVEADGLSRTGELGTASVRLVGERIRICVLLERHQNEQAAAVADQLLDNLGEGDEDYDTALSLVAVSAAFEAVADARANAVRARAERLLSRLGVIVPAELLVFGPTSQRTADRGS